MVKASTIRFMRDTMIENNLPGDTVTLLELEKILCWILEETGKFHHQPPASCDVYPIFSRYKKRMWPLERMSDEQRRDLDEFTKEMNEHPERFE